MRASRIKSPMSTLVAGWLVLCMVFTTTSLLSPPCSHTQGFAHFLFFPTALFVGSRWSHPLCFPLSLCSNNCWIRYKIFQGNVRYIRTSLFGMYERLAVRLSASTAGSFCADTGLPYGLAGLRPALVHIASVINIDPIARCKDISRCS